jgi:hypothetical protein
MMITFFISLLTKYLKICAFIFINEAPVFDSVCSVFEQQSVNRIYIIKCASCFQKNRNAVIRYFDRIKLYSIVLHKERATSE